MKKLTKKQIETKQLNIEIELARILEEEQKLTARKLRLQNDYYKLEERKLNLDKPKSANSSPVNNNPSEESILAVQQELKQSFESRLLSKRSLP